MTSPSIFDLGTVTLTNGSAEVTGDGTAWAVNGVSGGMFSCGGMSVPIASVESDTTLTLAYDWPGSNLAGVAYAISLLGSQAAETIWASRHWSRIVGQALLAGIVPVASGTLAERDALDPQPALGEWFAHAEPPYDLTFYRKVPEGWEGPYQFRGAASTIPGPAGDGFNPAGAWNISATYDKNDMVSHGPRSFVSFADGNTGNEPPNADEDDAYWQFVPAAVGPKGDTGDQGPQGEKGDTGDTGPAGPANVLTIGTVDSGETANASITGSSPAQVLNLVLPKGDKGDQGDEGPQGPPGQDGTGSGDVVGPSSATDGHMVVFDGTTGKLIKSAGKAPFSGNYGDLDNKPTLGTMAAETASDYAKVADLGNAAGLDVGTAAGTVAAGDDSRFSGNAKLAVEDQSLTGGARVTSKDLGTISSGTVTPDPGDRPLQHYTNGGAHTLAPGSNTGSYLLDITNNGSAGAITTSGWTKVSGDAFTTTNGHKFRCHCSIGEAGSYLVVGALQ